MTNVIYELPETLKKVLKDDAQYYWNLPVQRGLAEVSPIFEVLDGRAWIGGSFAAFMVSTFQTPIEPADIDIFVDPLADYDAVRGDVRAALRELGGFPWIADQNEIVETIAHQKGRPVQIVRGSPAWSIMPWDCLASFDLDVCRAMLVSPDRVICHVNAGDPYNGKILGINNSVKTMERVIKYAKRGVNFPGMELIKILKAWEATSPERRAEIIKQIELREAPYDPSYDVYSDEDYYDAE